MSRRRAPFGWDDLWLLLVCAVIIGGFVITIWH